MAERSVAGRLAAGGRDSPDDSAETAGLGARLVAYLLDSVFLSLFALVFAIIGGAVVFFSSDGGQTNPSDEAFSALVIVILLTIPAWLLFTLVMFWRRGQSVGHYLMGLEITRDDGGVPGNAQIVAYTLLLHPLLFNPIIAIIWAYAGYQSLIQESLLFLIISFTMAFICLLAPFLSLLFAGADGRRRGLHDRLAGMRLIKVLYSE